MLKLPVRGSSTRLNWHVDVRDAFRSLVRGRATTIAAGVILTLTIGAGTVTFSVVDAVALRPLPYGSPERLVSLSPPSAVAGAYRPSSPQDYFAWLAETQAFESIAAAGFAPSLKIDSNGAVETLRTQRITANLFDVLDVRPALGRAFGPEHEVPGGPPAVILSHGTWTRVFAADPHIVGRLVSFQQQPRQVAGVLPEGVSFPIGLGPDIDVYVPFVPTERDRAIGGGRSGFLQVVARLRSGVTLEQARADADRVYSGTVVVPLHERIVGPAGRWLVLVLLGVLSVLVVGCANVAHLLLARASTRVGEFATREALGASRRRLALGLLAEGLMLAMASAGAAIAAAMMAIEFVKTRLPPGLTRVSSIAIDERVLFACIGAAVLSALVFSSAPAYFAAKSDLMSLMKSSGGAVVGGRARILGGFLVANVAFVSVLLISTMLVVASYVVITTADLGFDRTNVALLSYSRSLEDLPLPERAAAAAVLRDELLDRVRSVPGVEAAAIAQNGTVPMSRSSVRYGLTIPGIGEVKGEDMLETNMVSPDYFRVMGMQLVAGRLFSKADGAGSALVMLINDEAAHRYFPGRDPVGQVVTFRGPTTIVGVLKSVRFDGPEEDIRPAMFTPIAQERFRGDTTFGLVLARTSSDPRGVAGTISEAIRQMLGGELQQPTFLDDYFQRSTAVRRFNAGVMAVFGIVAMLIGAAGVYGTTTFFVARQTRSIGVRIALGASSRVIVRAVLIGALRRVALGVVLGLTGAWAMSSGLQPFVFGIQPGDPRVYVSVAALLMLIGLVAALAPALRAAYVDPLTALRDE
jgi:predicted permease